MNFYKKIQNITNKKMEKLCHANANFLKVRATVVISDE